MPRFPMGYTDAEVQRQSVAGREGKRQDLTARVLVSGPKEPARYALLDVSHSIEKMRLKGTLGRDEAETIRRYKAARLFARMFDAAHPGAKSPMLAARVDGGGGNGEGARIAMLDASAELVHLQMHARGMTVTRYLDLEAVCAKGHSFKAHADATGRHHSTVTESIMHGLDAIADYEPWQRRLDAEVVLKIEPLPKRKRAA